MSTLLNFFRCLVIVALVVTFACNVKNKSDNKLDRVTKNMSFNEVQSITGEPTIRDDLGTVTDENGNTTHIVTWYYGDNESVTFVNGKVDGVDTDMRATNKRLQHIMDSAKAASER